jgi:glycosyltransferase involved in cell wall biosynthesis
MTQLAGLRVLMTTDAVGGVWIFSTTLARALARRQCRVMLVTLGPAPQPDQIDALAGCDGIELRCTDHPLEWVDPQGDGLLAAQRDLAAIAARFRPDLVHINGYREVLARWNAPVLVAAHSCVRSWWLACRGEEPAEPRWRRYTAMVASALAAADAWTAPTAAFAATIRSLYAPPTAGVVIHNGLETAPPRARKEPFVLGAGRLWDEAKNADLLARTAAFLPWPVRLVGPEPPRGGPAAANLELVGRLPHPALLRLMARAGIYAAPCRYEPFGLAALEAAAAGCALALADIPSLRELWSGAAVLVDPEDRPGWAATLRRLCEDEALRARLQRRARRRARRYSADAMTAAYGALYRALLPRHAIPTAAASTEVHA